jgi:hypothetical protein
MNTTGNESEESDGYVELEDFVHDEGDLRDTPQWHDAKAKKYEPLESFIGNLSEGCGFGELSMKPIVSREEELPSRIYSLVAMQPTYYLSISRTDFERITGLRKKIRDDLKRAFLKETYEFQDRAHSYLNKIIDNMQIIDIIPGQIIC